MALSVTHNFVSTKSDGADASLVRKTEWNQAHTLSGALDIANGGTAKTTAVEAFVNLADAAYGLTVPYDLGLAVTASASALTIAIKTAYGNDPASNAPVMIPFNNSTATTGVPEIVSVTAATSLTVSSGSTLGVTSSQAFRLWILGFNDSGTFRLGVINCSTGGLGSGTIYPLHEDGLESSTAEGGAGGADSAGIIYTGTAVTTKPYRILGFAEWSSSGLTAGTWTTTNLLYVRLFGPGMRKPGDVINVVTAQSSPNETTTSATFVTTATNSALTISSASNLIRVSCAGNMSINTNSQAAFAQWSRGSTNNTNMFGSRMVCFSTAGGTITASGLCYGIDKPNTTGSQTYTIQKAATGGATGTWGSGYETQVCIEEIMG